MGVTRKILGGDKAVSEIVMPPPFRCDVRPALVLLIEQAPYVAGFNPTSVIQDSTIREN